MHTAYSLVDYILAAHGRHPQLRADTMHTTQQQACEDGVWVAYENRLYTFADGHTLTREQEIEDRPSTDGCPACWIAYALCPTPAQGRAHHTFVSLCQERFWLNMHSACLADIQSP